MTLSETVIHQGIKFHRYPDSQRRSDRVYFTPAPADRRNGVGRLHEEIYRAEHGPIPDGHHVHHADHDPLNNDPSNLVAMSGRDHHRHHRADDPRTWSKAARDAAAEWHRTSPEAAALHAANGRKTMAQVQPRERVCEVCEKTYESRGLAASIDRFCSNRCKSTARYRSGVDDVDRTCERCSNTFRVNRYLRTRFCSRRCAALKP